MNALTLIEEPDNSKQVTKCLNELGHDVFGVDCYLKAKTCLQNEKIDLIISDVHLENGGSVFDFLNIARREENPFVIPFVLFSFKPSPQARYLAAGVRTTAHLLGANGYIEMQIFDSEKFQERINSLIGIHPVLTDI